LEGGGTALKFGFSLSRIAGRATPKEATDSDSVKTDGTKLTLRSTLHYLWDQAHFNRWAPNMAGKRNWFVIRKYLLQAAADKMAKGTALSNMLYLPETFSVERKDEIAQSRAQMMAKLAAPEKGVRKLQVLIGEVKEIATSRYGYKVVVKHLPDFHFMLNEDVWKRMNKRFADELELWEGLEDARLIVIATFSVGPTGLASIEEMALMVVTDNWIPFENYFDKGLIDTLTAEGRRFVKGLRYNLPSNSPLASAVLTDTTPSPIALYVITYAANNTCRTLANELIEESQIPSWLWVAGEGNMPALPALQGYERTPITVPLLDDDDEIEED
jgi:hypothetical protein